MDDRIGYEIKDRMRKPLLCDTALDGEIGKRFDRFVHERVMGSFAVHEILREAEECFRDKYDDEYAHGLWRGEFWGKLVLSSVGICRMKNSAALKEDIRRSAYRVLQYQEASGYLGSYQNGENIFPADAQRCIREVGWASCYNWNVWGQKYTLWALLECARLLDDRHILTCCERMADQLISLLARLGVRLKDAGVMYGMPACSIMKPMLFLYRLTGEKRYYDFCLEIAGEWERSDGECPNLITNALSGRSPADWYDFGEKDGTGWYAKAYEMMSCFEGLIELYRLSGQKKYLDAVCAFWESVRRDEENVLGSVGYCEQFAHAADYPDAATEICDVIHWMRLSRELFLITGEAKYMEAFEKAFFNAFLAGVYEDGRGGAFFVRSAGRHWSAEWQVETKYQHCCVNNVPRGFTDAAEMIVTEADEGYYVNLYAQARVRFGGMSLRIGAGYADRGAVAVTVRNMPEGKQLYLRIPAWSRRTRIFVVGQEPFETECCGDYLALPISRAEQVVRLQFDMTPEIIDFKGTFRKKLSDGDYHILRWKDANAGLCDRSLMLPHPMSVIRRGPVLLARSGRIGCSEEEMFDGETVSGRARAVTAESIRHDRMLTLCRVTIRCPEKKYHYLMCDYASAANRDCETPRFFTIYV